MARPSKGAWTWNNPPMLTQINVNCSIQSKKLLKRVAQQRGTSVSNLVRGYIIRGLVQDGLLPESLMHSEE